ncbi:MAG TPA: hypothetical protein VMC62_08325, partial [Longilinea sp.]|nr:hypothetical protein [Longilinea sp.]
MRFRVIAAIAVVFVIQIALLAFVWGSPALKAERAITLTPTPTPNYTPTPPPPTPIPTLYPAELAAPTRSVISQVNFDTGQCEIAALDLIAAWVGGGKPEQAAFDFKDINDRPCQGTFAKDVLPLFQEPNVWFSGAIACDTCHSADVKNAPVNLSLATYADILAGSHRTDPTATGQDILGNANSFP